MKLRAFIEERDVTPEISGADVRQVGPGIYSVLTHGQSFEIWVEPSPAGADAYVAGRRIPVALRDPMDISSGSLMPQRHAQQSICAPMPGKVIRVLVSQGQEVAAGQGVAVVEAMKMQNEMKASKPGKVAKVHVEDGATVTARQVLLTLE